MRSDLEHEYLQCTACQRMDREDHLWRRFAESNGAFGCRGCGGTWFRKVFQATAREKELLLKGAFRRYDQDPYLFHLWGSESVTESLATVPFANATKRKEGIVA